MAVAKFLDYLKHEKKYSEKTIESYQNDLNGFLEFYSSENESNDLSKARKLDIRNFLMHLSQKGLTERTINRKISAIKSYFKYLLKTGDIEQSPTSMISTLKHNNKVKIPISEDEIQKLLSMEGVFSDDFDGCRNRLIIEMFYQTGIRRAELIGLKVSDVDFSGQRIRVFGKRSKERLIPIGEDLSNKILTYLNERNKRIENDNGSLFLTNNNKALYDKFVYNIVNDYLSVVSTKMNKSPHILRHSFATHLLNHGANLNAVKELLGHSSLAATQVYTHSGIEQLKKVFNSAHPRSGKN